MYATEYHALRFAGVRLPGGEFLLHRMTLPLSEAWDLEFDSDAGFYLDSAGLPLATDPKVRPDEISQTGWLIWIDESNVVVIGDESPQCLSVAADVLRLNVLLEIARWNDESGYAQLRCDPVDGGVLVQYEYGSFRLAPGPEVAWHVPNPWGYFPSTPDGDGLTREFYNGGEVQIRLSDGRVVARSGPEELWAEISDCR